MSALIWKVSFLLLAFLIAITAAIVVIVSGDSFGYRVSIGVMGSIVAGMLVLVGMSWPPNRLHAAAISSFLVAAALAIYAVPYRNDTSGCTGRSPCDPVLDAQAGIRFAVFMAGAALALVLVTVAWRRTDRRSLRSTP